MNSQLKREMIENEQREIELKQDLRLYEYKRDIATNEVDKSHYNKKIEDLEYEMEIVRDRGIVFTNIQKDIAEEYYGRYA